MRSYSLRKKENFRRSSSRQLGVVVVLVFAALGAALVLGSIFGGALLTTSTPILSASSWITNASGLVPGFFSERATLLGKIADLETTNDTLRDALADTSAAREENDRLRELLGMEEAGVGARIGAGVLGRPPLVPYDHLVLDRGSADGIQEGAIVYINDTTAIGAVTETYEASALATLFSTPGTETTVYVIGPDIFTTAYGEGGGTIRVRVPQGLPLREGDVVVLPSAVRSTLGTITTVRANDSAPEQYGYVHPAGSLGTLRLVSVAREPFLPPSFETLRENVEDTALTQFAVPIPADSSELWATGTPPASGEARAEAAAPTSTPTTTPEAGGVPFELIPDTP
jgi:cell shape-determining protein MreC